MQDFLAGGPVSGSAPTLSAQLAADIAALWADPALGKAYDRRSEFQVQQIYLLIPLDGYALPQKGLSLTEGLPFYLSVSGVGKLENICSDRHYTIQSQKAREPTHPGVLSIITIGHGRGGMFFLL